MLSSAWKEADSLAQSVWKCLLLSGHCFSSVSLWFLIGRKESCCCLKLPENDLFHSLGEILLNQKCHDLVTDTRRRLHSVFYFSAVIMLWPWYVTYRQNKNILSFCPRRSDWITTTSEFFHFFILGSDHVSVSFHFTLIDSSISPLISFQNNEPCDVYRARSLTRSLTVYSSCLIKLSSISF